MKLKFSLLSLLSILLLSGCYVVKKDEAPVVPSAFVLESGPDRLSQGGWIAVYVIRHKETGARYVLAYYSSTGICISPLPDSPK